MRGYMKRRVGCGRKLLVLLAMGVLMSLLPVRRVSANEVVGYLYQAEKPMTAYADKDTSSAVVQEFAAGDPMMLVQEDDNWYQIYWQGNMAYIPKNGAAAAADTKKEAPAEEKEEKAEENATETEPEEESAKEEPVVDETKIKPMEIPVSGDKEAGDVIEQEAAEIQEEIMEQQAAYEAEQAAKKKAFIWRIVMVLLVIAIIAVSLVPAVINMMREKKKKETQVLREEASRELADLEEMVEEIEEEKEDGGEDDVEAEPEGVSGDEGDDRE